MSKLSEIKQKINDLQNVSLSQIDYGYLPPTNSTTYHAHVLLDILPVPPYVSSDADGSICFDYEFKDGKELELYFKIVGKECHYSYLWCPDEDGETWIEKDFVGDIRDDKLLVEILDLDAGMENGKS